MAVFLTVSNHKTDFLDSFLIKGTMTLGRSRKCHITIDDDFLSAHHCDIRLEGRYVIVKDMHSKNGCYINNNKITESYFYLGDIFSIGDLEMTLDPERMTREELEKTTFKGETPSQFLVSDVTPRLPRDAEIGGISKGLDENHASSSKSNDDRNIFEKLIRKIKN